MSAKKDSQMGNFEVSATTRFTFFGNPKFWIISALFMISAIWALGIPFGGVADEPAYLQYGTYSTSHDLLGNSNLNDGLLANIGNSPCFAFHPEVPASCQHFIRQNGERNGKPPLAPYPKIWFYLTAWPALLIQGQLGLVMCKSIAGILAVGIISIPIFYWRRSPQRLALSLAIALPSLSVQMIGSYNPNGFEIAGLISIALMLFGQNPEQIFRRSRFWWCSLWVITLLTSTAKPLTGLLIVLAFMIYFFINFLTIERYLSERFSLSKIKHLHNNQLLLLPLFALTFSYILTRPALLASKNQIQASHQGFFHLALGFLVHSESYAQEYAGLFGWRELGPAPWCTTIWITILAITIYRSAYKSIPRVKIGIFCTWIFVFVIAPAFEVISLANNYNVGLQTRYLAGIFGFAAVMTVALVPKYEIKGYFLAKASVFICLVNFVWVFLRFSIGYPNFTVKPLATFHYLLGNVSWKPLLAAPVLVAVCGIAIIIFIPHFFLKSTKMIYVAMVLTLLIAPITYASQHIERQQLNLNGLTQIDISIPDTVSRFPAGEISYSHDIEQTFRSRVNNLSAVQVLMATYNRINSGVITFEILDSQNRVIRHWSENTSYIIDNSNFNWRFAPIEDSYNNRFTLKITSSNKTPGNGLTVWVNPQKSGQYSLMYGGQPLNGSLIMSTWSS